MLYSDGGFLLSVMQRRIVVFGTRVPRFSALTRILFVSSISSDCLQAGFVCQPMSLISAANPVRSLRMAIQSVEAANMISVQSICQSVATDLCRHGTHPVWEQKKVTSKQTVGKADTCPVWHLTSRSPALRSSSSTANESNFGFLTLCDRLDQILCHFTQKPNHCCAFRTFLMRMLKVHWR